MGRGDHETAAWVVAMAEFNEPGCQLRSMETLRRFEAAPPKEGEPPALLVYFGALLRHASSGQGRLSCEESVALARPAAQQGQLQMLRKWVDEDKLLTPSEALIA